MHPLIDSTRLKGIRVLIVEDETLVALLLEDLLADLGCQVLDMAWRLPQAIKLADTTDADVAVLDVNIAGERVDPVADILERRQIPFVFATGYGAAGLPQRLKGHPVLQKPICLPELFSALQQVLAVKSGF